MEQALYIRIRGRVQGPFEPDKLKALAKRGQLSRMHQVSPDGANWQRASDYPDLFVTTATVPAAAMGNGAVGNGAASAPAFEEQTTSAEPLGAQGSAQWYYAKGESQFGPTDFEHLRQLAASGQLRPQDAVWSEGMSGWATADSIAGLTFGAAPQVAGSEHEPAGRTSRRESTEVSDSIVRPLLASKGWVTFLGVFAIILGGIALLPAMLLFSAAAREPEVLFLGLSPLLNCAVLVTTGVLLLGYSGAIRDLAYTPSTVRLAAAMRKLSTFWTFAGIVALVFLGLTVVVVLLMVLGLVGMAAALSDVMLLTL